MSVESDTDSSIPNKSASLPRLTEEDLAEIGGSAGVKAILRDTLPWLLCDLMDNGQIDESRLLDETYVLDTLSANMKWFNDRPKIVLLDDEFVDAARDSIESGRIGAAIVLIATSIEHQINRHIRFVLERQDDLSTDQITNIIKSNSLPAKIDWLLLLATGQSISEELSKRIGRVNEMRNAIVHYKFIPVGEDESTQRKKVYEQAEKFGFDTLLTTPHDLKHELENIERELFPNLARAFAIIAKMYS